MIIRILLLAALCVTSLATTSAQTVRVQLTDGRGLRRWYEPLPVRHRTADKKFWLLTAVSAALTVADVENSIHALDQHGTRELDPIFGRHPGRGRFYAINAPVFVITSLFSYRYKREDDALADAGIAGHKYVKWWLPEALNAGGHAAGVAITLTNTGR